MYKLSISFIHKKFKHIYKSGEPGLNRRPSPWQGDVLPLNYRRNVSLRLAVNSCSSANEYNLSFFKLKIKSLG